MGQDLPLPQAFQGKVAELLAGLQKATRVDQAEPCRDGLVLLGRGVAPSVVRALDGAGRKARWSLLQVLALLDGAEGGRALRQVLLQPRWKAREGCLCLAALGIPLERKRNREALADLARWGRTRSAWARISAFLGAARPGPPVEGLASLRGWKEGATAQERAAVLLFFARKGSKALVLEALDRFWPVRPESWGDRLLARTCCLAVAEGKLPGREPRILQWLASGRTRPEDRVASALALGALGVSPGGGALKNLAGSREWGAFFSLASAGPGGRRFSRLLEERLGLPGGKPFLKGVLAGAYARSLEDPALLGKASSSVGDPVLREILLLELARRVLAAPGKASLLEKAGRRTWDPRHEAEGLLVAALACRGAFVLRGGLPKGWALWAKAVRGEAPPQVVSRALERALRRRGAWPTQLLEDAWEETARAILYGVSEFYLQKFPGLAPPRGKGALPQGTPYRESPFYGWLDSFLRARPLFRKEPFPRED